MPWRSFKFQTSAVVKKHNNNKYSKFDTNFFIWHPVEMTWYRNEALISWNINSLVPSNFPLTREKETKKDEQFCKILIVFSNYFLSFLNPKKLLWFGISLFLWSVALGKIGKNNFPDWKKNVLFGTNIFPHEKTGKVKKIFSYNNCPDFYCLNNLF